MGAAPSWAGRGWLRRDALPAEVLDAPVVRFAYGRVSLGAQDGTGKWKAGGGATQDPRWHHACLLVELALPPGDEHDALRRAAWVPHPDARPLARHRGCDGPYAPAGCSAAADGGEGGAADALLAAEPAGPGEPPSARRLAAWMCAGFAALLAAAFGSIVWPLFLSPDAGEWKDNCTGGWWDTVGFGANERCTYATGMVARGVTVSNCAICVGVFVPYGYGIAFGIFVGFCPFGVAALVFLAGFGGSAGLTGSGFFGVVGYRCPFALLWNKRGTQVLPCLIPAELRSLELLGDDSPDRAGDAGVLWRVDYGTEGIVYFSPLDWDELGQHIRVAQAVGVQRMGWMEPRVPRALRELPRPRRHKYNLREHNCQDYIHRCIDRFGVDARDRKGEAKRRQRHKGWHREDDDAYVERGASGDECWRVFAPRAAATAAAPCAGAGWAPEAAPPAGGAVVR